MCGILLLGVDRVFHAVLSLVCPCCPSGPYSPFITIHWLNSVVWYLCCEHVEYHGISDISVCTTVYRGVSVFNHAIAAYFCY